MRLIGSLCFPQFIKQTFKGPSCVPGPVPGTASVNKSFSAFGKLLFYAQAAGMCADLERQPEHLCPGHSRGGGGGGGVGGGTVKKTSRVEYKDAVLQRKEGQAVPWGLE